MYEFNGWAVVEADAGGEEAADDLMARLKEHVATLPELTRLAFHFGEGINGFNSVMVSGLRNHPRPEVTGVFHWLARESRRSYGLLHVRLAGVDDLSQKDRMFVWRLWNGAVTYHEDPFFT